MKKTLAALALLTIGYLAGGSHASAGTSTDGIVSELRGIKGELQTMRRVLEKGAKP